jgi:hypothetical protein
MRAPQEKEDIFCMSTGGTMEIETLSAMNGGMYPSLPTMLEAIALITIIFAIAGAAICLAGIAWLCFEETRQPARRRMKSTPESPEPDEYELLAVLTALDDVSATVAQTVEFALPDQRSLRQAKTLSSVAQLRSMSD